MSLNDGFMFIQVLNPEVWQRFDNQNDGELGLAKLFDQGKTTFLLNDGASTAFEAGELSDLVESLSQTLKNDGIILACETNISVDPFITCYYYLGDRTRVAEYNDPNDERCDSFGTFTDSPEEWLFYYNKYALSEKETETLKKLDIFLEEKLVKNRVQINIILYSENIWERFTEPSPNRFPSNLTPISDDSFLIDDIYFSIDLNDNEFFDVFTATEDKFMNIVRSIKEIIGDGGMFIAQWKNEYQEEEFEIRRIYYLGDQLCSQRIDTKDLNEFKAETLAYCPIEDNVSGWLYVGEVEPTPIEAATLKNLDILYPDPEIVEDYLAEEEEYLATLAEEEESS